MTRDNGKFKGEQNAEDQRRPREEPERRAPHDQVRRGTRQRPMQQIDPEDRHPE
ncbi:MAG: hypothetical protein IKC53_01155 [Lentisphaeria bacterium]|nr:hypothetical protein [Lentisphaeria bacterium]